MQPKDKKTMTQPNNVRITLQGFNCTGCGAIGAASPGAIMSAYMREVIAFERVHKACAKKSAISEKPESSTPIHS